MFDKNLLSYVGSPILLRISNVWHLCGTKANITNNLYRLTLKFYAVSFPLIKVKALSSNKFVFNRYHLVMPANSNLRRNRHRGYNPLNEAETPVPRDVWERRVNKTSLKPKRKSDTFRIPKTTSQEPATVMPGAAHPPSHTTYADSRKSDPTQARRSGSASRTICAMPSINSPNLFPSLVPSTLPALSTKKAHLQWLHSTAN